MVYQVQIVIFFSLLSFGCKGRPSLLDGWSYPNGSAAQESRENVVFKAQNKDDGISDFITIPETHRFTGGGTLTHRGGDNTTKQIWTARLTSEILTINLESITAVSGDHKSDVNDDLRNSTGEIVHEILKISSDSNHSDDVQRIANFAPMTNKITDRTGGKNTILDITGDAIPALIIPAPGSRFRALREGDIQLRSQVVSSQSFELITIISLVSENENFVKISLEFQIPQDQAGRLYGFFPLPRKSIYTIDGQNRRITAVSSEAKYHESKKNRAYSNTMNSTLCSIQKDGEEVELIGNCT
jgi:hypothetical protein